MFEDIKKAQMLRRQNILKSFGTTSEEVNLEKAAEDELEKAHQPGDVHPNGKWVWVVNAAGKGDWRTMNGRAHKKSGSSQSKEGVKEEEKKESTGKKTLGDHAKGTSTDTLKRVVASDKASDDLKAAAKKELANRGEKSETETSSEKKKPEISKKEKETSKSKETSKKESKKTSSDKKETKKTTEDIVSNFEKYKGEYNDYLYENEVSKEAEQAFKDFESLKPKSGKIFDWTERDEADEYKKKWESKGYKVVETSGDGSDTISFSLIEDKDSKNKKEKTVENIVSNFEKYKNEYNDYLYENEVSKEAEHAFKDFESLKPEGGRIFDWTESDDAEEYKKKEEKKGYIVVDTSGDSDTISYVLVKKDSKK